MNSFLQQHATDIYGVLSGFDRVRFRGTHRTIAFADGFARFLGFLRILLTRFRAFVDGTTKQLKDATQQLAKQTPAKKILYLNGSHDKQQELERVLRQYAVPDDHMGLLAIFSCVENCRSFDLHKNAQTQHLEIQPAARKCLHYYLYIRHPKLGLLHLRIMTWFPLTVQLCLNGREWLANQLTAAGIAYHKVDNTFTWVADFDRAQQLLDQQLATNWEELLVELLQTYHPEFMAVRERLQLRPYYWTAEQTEWATDIAFRSPAALQALYPRLVQHAMTHFASPDVLRFLQQKVTATGQVDPRFQGEVVSDLKRRVEGTRVKHRLGANSVKMYDKSACVLRIETTIHDASGLKVYRPKGDAPDAPLAWQPLRRSVADLQRRCVLSQHANAHYVAALAVVTNPERVGPLVAAVSQRVERSGRRYRGLNLLSATEVQWLQLISRGEYALVGFRNRDLRAALEPASTAAARRYQSGQVTRYLGLLRAHGLIQKIPHTHRYRLTDKGHRVASVVHYVNEASLNTLSQGA